VKKVNISGGPPQTIGEVAGGYDGTWGSAGLILSPAFGEKPEATVLINAEAGVRHGEMVGLLDVVRGLGFSGVAFGTRAVTDTTR